MADVYEEAGTGLRLSPGRSRLLLALLVVAAAIYAVVVARYLDRPLRFDEIEFPIQAENILRYGVPKALYSELSAIWLSPYQGYETYYYGMWHPPLYQYSLALGVLVLGGSNAALRGVSVLWFCASLLVAWQILRLILPRDTPVLLRAVPFALILLTPLVSEGSLLLEVDNTSLTFLLLLFSYAFLRAPLDTSWRRCLALGLMLALALWAKLTSPFLLLGAAVLFLLLSRQLRGAIRLAAVAFPIGLGLYLLTHFLFCNLLDYPPLFMFECSYLTNSKISHPSDLWPIVQSVRWHTVWLSPGIALLLLFGLAARVREYLRQRRTEPADFLLLSAALIFFFYVAWGGQFGKYTVPGAILGLLGLAPRLVGALRGVQLERPRALLALCAALLFSHALLLPALQPRPPRAAAPSHPWRDSILDFRNLVLLLALGSLALFYLFSRRFLSSSGGATVLVSLVLYVAIANPVNILKTVLPDYDRSPYRPFFDRGFSEVVDGLNREYGKASVILCPKDVGYYFRGRYYPMESVGSIEGMAALRLLIEEGSVDAVTDNLKYPTLTDPMLLRRLDELGVKSKFGDYVVWRLGARR